MTQDRFIRALGLRDVILMNIVAIVGLRWIARGARTGPASIALWTLACLAFFVPLAYAVSELSSRSKPSWSTTGNGCQSCTNRVRLPSFSTGCGSRALRNGSGGAASLLARITLL